MQGLPHPKTSHSSTGSVYPPQLGGRKTSTNAAPDPVEPSPSPEHEPVPSLPEPAQTLPTEPVSPAPPVTGALGSSSFGFQLALLVVISGVALVGARDKALDKPGSETKTTGAHTVLVVEPQFPAINCSCFTSSHWMTDTCGWPQILLLVPEGGVQTPNLNPEEVHPPLASWVIADHGGRRSVRSRIGLTYQLYSSSHSGIIRWRLGS